MKYDFTTIMDRSGKDALAIDNVGQHMWGCLLYTSDAADDEVGV